jgi:hypothetical protein
MTLVFFHKNKFILTEFPWLVKDLQRNPDSTDFDTSAASNIGVQERVKSAAQYQP